MMEGILSWNQAQSAGDFKGESFIPRYILPELSLLRLYSREVAMECRGIEEELAQLKQEITRGYVLYISRLGTDKQAFRKLSEHKDDVEFCTEYRKLLKRELVEIDNRVQALERLKMSAPNLMAGFEEPGPEECASMLGAVTVAMQVDLARQADKNIAQRRAAKGTTHRGTTSRGTTSRRTASTRYELQHGVQDEGVSERTGSTLSEYGDTHLSVPIEDSPRTKAHKRFRHRINRGLLALSTCADVLEQRPASVHGTRPSPLASNSAPTSIKKTEDTPGTSNSITATEQLSVNEQKKGRLFSLKKKNKVHPA